MPLDVPFELASPSPSADMLLSVRLRLDLRRSVGAICAAGELVAPSGRWSRSSSEPVRRLRPSIWRAEMAEAVVEGALWVLGSGAELGRLVVVWVLCC